MKRLEPESIGDVFRRALEEENLTQKLLETRACSLWARVVGPGIAAGTSRPYVTRGVMTVGVPSASLRQDLQMSRSILVQIINKALGDDVIRDIRFTS